MELTIETPTRFLITEPRADDSKPPVYLFSPRAILFYMRLTQFYDFTNGEVTCKILGGLYYSIDNNMIVTEKEAVSNENYTNENRYMRYPPVSLIFTFPGSICIKLAKFLRTGSTHFDLIKNVKSEIKLPSYSASVLSSSSAFFPAVVKTDEFFDQSNPHYRRSFYGECNARFGYFKGVFAASTTADIDSLPHD